jgi:hypothetical protein
MTDYFPCTAVPVTAACAYDERSGHDIDRARRMVGWVLDEMGVLGGIHTPFKGR